MELQKPTSRSVAPTAIFDLESDPERSRLRQIGFHTLMFSSEGETHNFRSSVLHQLGRCTMGEVHISVRQVCNRSDAMIARYGDIFFIPSNSAYQIENACSGTSRLLIASASNAPKDADVQSAERLISDVIAQNRYCEHAPSPPGFSRFRVTGEKTHVVSFYSPTCGEGGDHGVASAFDRELLLREFGVKDREFPDLSSLNFDPIVIRRSSDRAAHVFG